MVFVKKSIFLLYIFFLAKKARKKHSLIFWIENNAFWTSKVKFSQSRKKSTFFKGVSSWFLSKNRLFSHIFFFWEKKNKKETFFYFLGRKECFLDPRSEVLGKWKKISTFCKLVSTWFLSKNRPFSYMFFFYQKRQKETFFDILDTKECFLTWKVKF